MGTVEHTFEWRKGFWWALVLVILVVAAAGITVSSVTHAGTGALTATGADHRIVGEPDSAPGFTAWEWEWQPGQESATGGRPAHLR